MYISVSEFVIHYLLGIQLLTLARTCKECINTILGYFSISQSNHYIMMVSVCTDKYCIRPSAKLWLGLCVHVMYNWAS